MGHVVMGGGAVAEEALLTCHSLYSPVPTKPRPSTSPCIQSEAQRLGTLAVEYALGYAVSSMADL